MSGSVRRYHCVHRDHPLARHARSGRPAALEFRAHLMADSPADAWLRGRLEHQAGAHSDESEFIVLEFVGPPGEGRDLVVFNATGRWSRKDNELHSALALVDGSQGDRFIARPLEPAGLWC